MKFFEVVNFEVVFIVVLGWYFFDQLFGDVVDEVDLVEVVLFYGCGVWVVMEVGFDGINIYGVYGYLIDSFFWLKINL